MVWINANVDKWLIAQIWINDEELVLQVKKIISPECKRGQVKDIKEYKWEMHFKNFFFLFFNSLHYIYNLSNKDNKWVLWIGVVNKRKVIVFHTKQCNVYMYTYEVFK